MRTYFVQVSQKPYQAVPPYLPSPYTRPLTTMSPSLEAARSAVAQQVKFDILTATQEAVRT